MIKKYLFLSTCITLFTSVLAVQPALSKPDSPVCVAPGTWFDPDQGQTLSTPDVLARAKTADVVLLAETHTNFDHHRWQLQTLAQLHAARPDMILGLESFPRRVQPILDQWVAGTLSQKEFLKQSDWNSVWKFDAKLYMGLFNFARLNRVPMLALNVDKSLTRNVSKLGWDKVPQKDRLGISDPTPPSKAYLNMLAQVYNLHDRNKDNTQLPTLDDPSFASFVGVQVTWDVAMADALAKSLRSAQQHGRSPQLVAIIGRGHLQYGYGVPHQLAAMNVQNIQVLSPWDLGRPCSDFKNANDRPIANAVFGLGQNQDMVPVSGPKLGVMIENATDGGVLVSGVLDKSVAKTTGLLKDDIILKAATQDTLKVDDLVRVVKSMGPGTWMPLTIKRGSKTIDLVARFPVQPPKPMHP
ncbi:MAG: ChaN family lipoprotein [Magnetovibrio sp.]|nr:ChaN family lipoprotein [Magnetovibrio sp.]